MESGTAVPGICRKLGISEPTFYRWKKAYGGLMPSEVKKLRQLEEENGKLKRSSRTRRSTRKCFRRSSENALTPARSRELIDFVRTAFRVSIRRAAQAVPAHRSTYHYKSRRPEQAVLRQRIRELAHSRVRWGYERIHVLLRREGWKINRKRTHRLYRLEGLSMRLKTPRRRVMPKIRDDRSPATGPNEIWAMDWMADQLFDGRKIWILTIVDTWSRVAPSLRVVRVATAMEAIAALDKAVARFGVPKQIRVDQGCQFTSRELDLWAYAKGVVLDFSRRGKPTDNAYIESFNARVRAECLNQHWFLDMDDARKKVEEWRVEYNEVRPHSAIGDRLPMALIS